MIAVALSGGVDSAAAAILLKEQGNALLGITMSIGDNNPLKAEVERARLISKYLGIEHHIIDLEKDFLKIKNYFCKEYLIGNTPNPCAMCNRHIKFGVLLDKAKTFGASKIATGHYVKKIEAGSRLTLAKAKERKSQEYFMGLISQESLKHALFPLSNITKQEAGEIVKSCKLDLPQTKSSQDVCFIPSGDYVGFIERHAGFIPAPGCILNTKHKKVGMHKGALHYTIGQRKGLGMGFGSRMYILATDMENNTITVGSPDQWPYNGFFVTDVNYMKIDAIPSPLEARVQIRYQQKPQQVFITSTPTGQLWVDFKGMFAPGQLAVFYDEDDTILCAGIIKNP
jgi:tRNA-specific 2-thiouridylase